MAYENMIFRGVKRDRERQERERAIKTYRLGVMESDHDNKRALFCIETGDTLRYVTCDYGPSVIGDMTEERARRLFPEAFED